MINDDGVAHDADGRDVQTHISRPIVIAANRLPVMRDGSICGLGQAAPNPVECVLRHFPQELEP